MPSRRLPRMRAPAYWRPTVLAMAAAAVSLGSGLTPLAANAQPATHAADKALRSFSIPSASVETALNQLAREAQVMIAFDPELVQGKQSRGFKGVATVQGVLDSLLESHPLQAQSEGQGAWRIRPAPARAQKNAAGAAGGALERNMNEVTVVAKKDARQQVFETAGSVAVVTREEIDRLPPRNTADVLAEVPGVYTSQSRRDPGVSVNIRGMQDFGRVNVMIDGTRQNYQQSGHGSNGSVYLDPEMIGGVDISKGPTSTVGGAGMIAGVVNFRTLEADDLVKEDKTRGARLNLSSGSNGYHFAGSAALGLKPSEDVDMVMLVSRKKVGEFEKGRRESASSQKDATTHGVSQLTSQDQTSVLLKGSWRFAPEQQIKLSYIGMDAKFGEKPQSASGGGILNHVRTDTLLANYTWSLSENALVDLKSSLYYTRTRNQAHRYAGGTLDSYAYDLRYQTSTVGGTLENTSRFEWGPKDAALVKTGAEFFHDWTDPQAQALSVGADAGTTALYSGATPKGKRTVASLFGEVNWMHSDWLELTGGLRYDWYGMQGDGRMRVGSLINPPGVRPPATALYTRFKADRNDGAFAPRLALALKPIESVQLFASAGRGMRPPALTEALMWGQHTGSLFPYYPNPDLRAERSRNWEVGANGMFDDVLSRGDKLRVKAAWFNNKVKDYVTLARIMSPIDTAGGGLLGPYAYVNLQDPFRSKGLELQGDYDNGRVFGSLNYTHMLVNTGKGGYDSFPLGSLTGYPHNNLGEAGDANIWYVLPPKKTASLSAGVRLLDKKLTLGGRMRFQAPSTNSSVWTAQGERYNQKSWRLFDLWASYELSSNAILRVAINNLRDLNYSEMQGGSYFIGPGRTATATLSITF